MENKKHIPDYEISTYNKRAPKGTDVIDRIRQDNKGGADEHSSSTNQQR